MLTLDPVIPTKYDSRQVQDLRESCLRVNDPEVVDFLLLNHPETWWNQDYHGDTMGKWQIIE